MIKIRVKLEVYKVMRLQKYMALCGIGSRRKCEKYIEEARVKVNGQIVTKMGYKIDPSKDKVLLDERLISLNKDMYYVLSVSYTHLTLPTKRIV